VIRSLRGQETVAELVELGFGRSEAVEIVAFREYLKATRSAKGAELGVRLRFALEDYACGKPHAAERLLRVLGVPTDAVVDQREEAAA